MRSRVELAGGRLPGELQGDEDLRDGPDDHLLVGRDGHVTAGVEVYGVELYVGVRPRQFGAETAGDQKVV
ncbi:hypothetical protein [Streptomyces lydicus]|uniref:hypothetical protein n=1 Tax=Streptomyces lydicus TaxID=47763 RepID=UPI0037B7ED41